VGVVDVCVPPDVSGVCADVPVIDDAGGGICVAGVDVPVIDDAGVCVPPGVCADDAGVDVPDTTDGAGVCVPPAPAPGDVRFCGSLGVGGGGAAAVDIYYYCYIVILFITYNIIIIKINTINLLLITT
jgi:hypothetical protein